MLSFRKAFFISSVLLFYAVVYNAHLAADQDSDGNGGEAIANGTRVQQTVNTHDARKNVCTGQEVEQLPCKRADHSLCRLADRLKEDTRGNKKADEEDNTEEDVEALEGKLVVQFVLLSENIDNFLGEELEASPTDHTHDKTYDDSS